MSHQSRLSCLGWLLSVVLFYSLISAQMVQTSSPAGGDIIGFASDELKLFAATNNGVFSLLNDGTWKKTNSGLGNLNIKCMVTSEGTVIAATNGGVYLSLDSGYSWTQRNTGLPSENWVYSVAICGKNLLTATFTGVFLSTNQGIDWHVTLPDYRIAALCVNEETVYAAATDGLFVSEDSGITWVRRSFQPTDITANCLVVNGKTILAGTTFDGVFRSVDQGVSWAAINEGFSLDTAYHRSPSITGICKWGTTLFAATSGCGIFSQTDSDTIWKFANSGIKNRYIRCICEKKGYLYAGTYTGVYLSSDTGKTWIASNQGLDNSDVLCLTTVNDSSIICGGSFGVAHTTNDGSSWTDDNLKLANDFLKVTTVAAIGKKVFASVTGLFPGYGIYMATDTDWVAVDPYSPNLKTGKAIVAAFGNTLWVGSEVGIRKSIDTAKTWIKCDSGLSDHPLVLSFTQNGNDVFVATGSNVFRSRNGGQSWQKADSGLPQEWINTLYSEEGYLFAGTTSNGIFRSTDSGAKWLSVAPELANLNIGKIVGNGDIIFASAGNHLYFSTDTGLVWNEVITGLSPNITINSLTLRGSNLFISIKDQGVSIKNNAIWRMQLSDLRSTKIANVPHAALVSQTLVSSRHYVKQMIGLLSQNRVYTSGKGYNFLGQQVSARRITSNLHVATGIYFLKSVVRSTKR